MCTLAVAVARLVEAGTLDRGVLVLLLDLGERPTIPFRAARCTDVVARALSRKSEEEEVTVTMPMAVLTEVTSAPARESRAARSLTSAPSSARTT
jgi:hypothetical protein